MKRTYFLDAIRNIRRELVSYISILVVALLASTAFLCISYSSEAMKRAASSYYKNYNFWDLEAIRAVPGVEEAEAVWQTNARLRLENRNADVSIISAPEKTSLPELPESAAECAV